MRLASRLRVLLVTFWAGSLWTVGYVVAPTLFATLSDRVLAGTIAGSLFRIEAWLSVACAAALLVLQALYPHSDDARMRKIAFALIGAMLLCTLIGYFGIQPYMAALKEAAGAAGVTASGTGARFGILHGISSAFYLVQSLLAIALVLRVRAA